MSFIVNIPTAFLSFVIITLQTSFLSISLTASGIFVSAVAVHNDLVLMQSSTGSAIMLVFSPRPWPAFPPLWWLAALGIFCFSKSQNCPFSIRSDNTTIPIISFFMSTTGRWSIPYLLNRLMTFPISSLYVTVIAFRLASSLQFIFL